MARVQSYHIFSDNEIYIIEKALEIFLESPEDVIINEQPVLKRNIVMPILQKLQLTRTKYTIKELIVIKGCLHLYHSKLPWITSRRISRKINSYLREMCRE